MPIADKKTIASLKVLKLAPTKFEAELLSGRDDGTMRTKLEWLVSDPPGP